MIEKLEQKGFFWLPQEPDKKIPGIIRFSPNSGIELELIGSLAKRSQKYEIILGFTEKGKYLTLLNSFERTRSMNFPGIQSSYIVSNYLFSGPDHLPSKKHIKFYKAVFQMKFLDEWLNRSEGFNLDSNERDREITIKYKLPDSINIDLDNSFRITLNPTAKGPSLKLVQKDAQITQTIYAIFQNNRKKKFNDILKIVFDFQELLILFSQRRSYPTEFYLLQKDENGKFTKKFDLYFQIDTQNENPKELIPYDFLVPYHAISDNLNDVINNWYNSQELLEPCYTPYFNNFYKKDQYISDKFLNIARAIEAFHRDTVGVRDPSTGRPYHYKKRVIEIFSSCSRAFNGLLKIRNKNNFAEKIKNFRNDFTHSNPILIQRNKKYLEAYYLTEKLTIIFTCAILKYHGFSTTRIKNFILNTRLYAGLKYGGRT